MYILNFINKFLKHSEIEANLLDSAFWPNEAQDLIAVLNIITDLNLGRSCFL